MKDFSEDWQEGCAAFLLGAQQSACKKTGEGLVDWLEGWKFARKFQFMLNENRRIYGGIAK